MKLAIRDAGELCRLLRLPAEYEQAARRAARLFPVFAPAGYLARIQPGNPGDPLLRQILPLEDELVDAAGFEQDPVGDAPATLRPGLLQKYHGRVLMVTTGACAVHCRYCFRRHYPYSSTPRSSDQWNEAIERIAADPAVEEVVLSGGDPLTLTDGQLTGLAARLSAVPHLRRLRIHTRLPVMIPQRVTPELTGWLRGTRLTTIVVVHVNHPAELDRAVVESFERLVDAGVPLLNQTVLLRGVNDDADTLVELCRRLVDCRVMPYYLHQLDRVAGAAHFEVPVRRGQQLMRELHARLPGYAVPRYVREVAGAAGKLEFGRQDW